MNNSFQKLLLKLTFAVLAVPLIVSTRASGKLNLQDDRINSLIGCEFEEYDGKEAQIIKSANPIKAEEKDWTLIIYISADNDLRNFAIRNIKQMAKVGSTAYVNIAVHLDIRITGNKKVTRRYYIEKDRILHVNADDAESQKMDSGNPETLISCCKWAAESFPAKNYGLILWNHGTGIICPPKGRIIKTTDLFSFNPITNKIELDRNIGFFDLLNTHHQEQRGICWDDSTGNYLTNKDLDYALETICTDILGNQKLELIGFDACLMQMIEIANITKKYANLMIGSQEVILGTGWNYRDTLKPFITQTLTPEELAFHVVTTYSETYEKITNDFTLSAINLHKIDELEENINEVARLLLYGIKWQKNESIKKAISASKNRQLCTHFDEPSFIDLHHFYKNLLASAKHLNLINKKEEAKYKQTITNTLIHGCNLIEDIIIARASGKNLRNAKGVSIYFPSRIHYSYRSTDFAKDNDWILLLTQYLSM